MASLQTVILEPYPWASTKMMTVTLQPKAACMPGGMAAAQPVATAGVFKGGPQLQSAWSLVSDADLAAMEARPLSENRGAGSTTL